ncbi:ABC transporter substrate-binding protein [Desulfosarcina sp.]|nr:ABC transporter substrate-binding protein [Desulfosarcina sp.]
MRTFAIINFILISMLVIKPVLGSEASIRLGWQVPWATQGQLVMGLQHTNIPQLNNLNINYVGFAYGGPLNKAAIAGEVDILLTADHPALVLMSKKPGYRIVSRMMYNRVCIYAPNKSTISDLKQLEGKTVMGPIGAAAERVALQGLRDASVNVDSLRIGKLDMAQQSALLSREGSESSWAGVDALFGFDPLPAVFQEQGKARMLHCGKVVSVVVASPEMLKRKDELKRFLQAFRMSWYYYANNPQVVNQQFSKQSRLNVSDAVLDEAASIEPNRWTTNSVEQRFVFKKGDLEILEEAQKYLLDRKILKAPLDISGQVDTAIMESLNETGSGTDRLSKIKAIPSN